MIPIRGSVGAVAAQLVSDLVGSWAFVLSQSVVLAAWLTLNTLHAFHSFAWDNPPFILLNLGLSFQAAYTGPILLIAARRQEELQRHQLRYMLTLLETVAEHLETDADLARRDLARREQT